MKPNQLGFYRTDVALFLVQLKLYVVFYKLFYLWVQLAMHR